jgi:hypothetical protein
MRQIIVGFAMLCGGTAALAADFGHSRKDRMQINSSFNAMADMCVRDFGFTRVPKKPDAVLVDKMEAYLLLASSADFVIHEWAGITSKAHAMTDAEKDDALAERLADALIAAQKDPDSYARAEALYVDTLKAPANTVAGACRVATNDAFIGANYLTGDGSADRYDDKLRQMFADSVKDSK